MPFVCCMSFTFFTSINITTEKHTSNNYHSISNTWLKSCKQYPHISLCIYCTRLLSAWDNSTSCMLTSLIYIHVYIYIIYYRSGIYHRISNTVQMIQSTVSCVIISQYHMYYDILYRWPDWASVHHVHMILARDHTWYCGTQSSRMDFMLRLPNCTDKHQMLTILTNPTSDIWILRLTSRRADVISGILEHLKALMQVSYYSKNNVRSLTTDRVICLFHVLGNLVEIIKSFMLIT